MLQDLRKSFVETFEDFRDVGCFLLFCFIMLVKILLYPIRSLNSWINSSERAFWCATIFCVITFFLVILGSGYLLAVLERYNSKQEDLVITNPKSDLDNFINDVRWTVERDEFKE